MMRQEDSEVDLGDYFPSSERNLDEMFAELRAFAAGIANPHLRALLDSFLDDEKIARMYRTAPAAKTVHHNYLGGLIEHVLSLCHLCRMTAAHYKNIDLDLLLAGAILHDVGKTTELTYERTFGYSTDGQLLGHIVIGLQMINEKLARFPDFPPKLRSLLEHMIVSHHGELAFGSPKVPVFPEALLLHHLDNLDSKMECMRAMIAKDRNVEGVWTMYNSTLDRSVLKKMRYLEELEPARPEPPPANGIAPPVEPPVMAAVQPLPAPPKQTPPPDPPRAEKPVSVSPFAEKLQQAIRR
jgi:3'-5' exoribonuclease